MLTYLMFYKMAILVSYVLSQNNVFFVCVHTFAYSLLVVSLHNTVNSYSYVATYP